MTIEEKYLELREKSVNRKNNRYLLTYLENQPKSRQYIALLKRRNKPQNVLNISRDTFNVASGLPCPLTKIVYASWKVLTICLRTSKRWLILCDSVRCCENFWSLEAMFWWTQARLLIGWKVSRDQLALSLKFRDIPDWSSQALGQWLSHQHHYIL